MKSRSGKIHKAWFLCRSGALVGVAAVLVMIAGTRASAAPLAEVFGGHDPASTRILDTGPWNSFLERYVEVDQTGLALMRYGEVTGEDRAQLKSWLAQMAAIDPGTLARDTQFAWWVNLYNALTVNLVLSHYPLASIKDIDRFSVTSRGPWNDVLITIAGHGLTLDDIEHEILRPLWKDPRIHYVVNCASIGCPNLAPAALQAVGLEARLDEAAASYINHPRGVTVVRDGLEVSSLYKWYAEDFGGDDAAIIAHLRGHARAPLAGLLKDAVKITRYGYNWSLNDAARAQDPSQN